LAIINNISLKFHDEYELPSKRIYKKVSQEWETTIKKNTKEINKIIDIYFNTIYAVITKNDKLILSNKT
jgi:hypothetical protein